MDSGYLASVLTDLGASSCDQHMFADVLQQLAPLIGKGSLETQIALALAMMMKASSNAESDGWNTATFGRAVLDAFPKIDVNRILECLDYTDFVVTNANAADMLVSFFKALTGKGFYQSIQLSALMKPWTNLKGQLSLLFNLLLIPVDTFNFSMFAGRKVISSEDYASLSPAAKNIAVALTSQTWNCFDLFQFTASIIDTDNFEDAKPIFELASRQCPELLCIALASMDPSWNSINKEILVKLSCGFLLGQPSSSVVLPRLWALNANVLLFCMVEMHRRDATCLSRLLDVAHELKILSVIMDARPYSFTLDLACLASRRQNLNIEKWLGDSFQEKGEAFVRSAAEFVVEKISTQHTRTHASTTPSIPVPLEVIQVFIKLLLMNFSLIPEDVAGEFRQAVSLLAPDLPSSFTAQLQSTVAPDVLKSVLDANATPALTLAETEFSADVEEDVNSFFDRIFAREVSVTEAIETLRRLKSSASARDQQVFACFLHNIFDEFRFFSKYPDDELNLTAMLFGQLINCQLIAQVPLGLALKCVLEATKKPANNKLFRFGLQALMQFSSRLVEWPQFCTHIVQIAHLQQMHPELYAYIHSCAMGSPSSTPVAPRQFATLVDESAAGSVATTTGSMAAPTASLTSPDSSTSSSGNPLFEAADKQSFAIPPDGVRERILFIINNLSPNNMESKANDLIKIFDRQHFSWLAQYLVVRRASLEPNYHHLYLDFLDMLEMDSLNQKVLDQTYFNISILLKSSKIVSSTSERSLLKNLGMWLGGLTLARNRPILYKDLCFKDLIVDAFTKDRLIIVVPFVCKVLEQCTYSRAFNPDNPWVMSLLRLLAELYSFADLKLNLKFEVEVLCKNLEIELQSIEPSDVFKQHASTLLQGAGGGAISGDSRMPIQGLSSGDAIMQFIDGTGMSRDASDTNGNVGTSASSMQASGGGMMWAESAFLHLVSFNSCRIGNGRYQAVIKSLLAKSIEYAIRDLALVVAQRCFIISMNTARALIGKDFAVAVEAGMDRAAMFKAAMSLAPSLCANLAFITSRENLKLNIINNLRAFCEWGGMSHLVNELMLDGLAEENMDLACAYVEKVAFERASANISAIIPPDFDSKAYAFSLDSKSAMISREQSTVYGEFVQKFCPAHLANLPNITLDPIDQRELERFASAVSAFNNQRGSGAHFASSTHMGGLAGSSAAAGTDLLTSAGRQQHEVLSMADGQHFVPMSPGVPTNETLLPGPSGGDRSGGAVSDLYFENVCHRFVDLIQGMEQSIERLEGDASGKNVATVASLPPSHEVRSLMKQIVLLASSSPIHRDELCLLMSQRLMQGLYKTRSALYVDVIILLLIKIFEFSSKAAKEVTTWVVHSSDLRKYSVLATVALFSSGLIYVLDFDNQLAKQIASATGDRAKVIVTFALQLIRKCIFDNPPVAAPYDFVYSLEALGKTTSADHNEITTLLKDIANLVRAPQPELQQLRDRISFCFTDWFRLCQYPSISEKLISSFVSQLFQRRFLCDEASARPFFQICTEICIELYVRQRRAPAILAYRSVDSFARLVGQIIKFHPNGAAQNEGVIEIMDIISIVHNVAGMILMQGLDQGLDYLQKPFSRLFVLLASEIIKNLPSSINVSTVIDNLSSFYVLLSPKTYPSFAFGWLEIITNREYLPHLLLGSSNPQQMAATMAIIPQRHTILFSMLAEYLEFAYPILQHHDASDASRALYRGILRTLLVILHDCPKFFITYGLRLLVLLPPTVIQLRNVILSAVPADLVLSDPLTVKMDGLATTKDFAVQFMVQDISAQLSPKIKSACDQALSSKMTLSGPQYKKAIKALVDVLSFILPSNASFLHSVSFRATDQIQLAIAYLCLQDLLDLDEGSNLSSSIKHGVVTYDLVMSLFAGDAHSALLRYLVLTFVADQLTFPCGLTGFAYGLFMRLFADATMLPGGSSAALSLKEVITRVLLERLIVHRPHPWGIMVTFIELVKNPSHSFWDLHFTRATPDIERVFSAIASSCLGSLPAASSA